MIRRRYLPMIKQAQNAIVEIIINHLSHNYSKFSKWKNMNTTAYKHMVYSQLLAHVLWQTQFLHDLKMLFYIHHAHFAYNHLHEKFALSFVLTWIAVAFVIHLVAKNIYIG